MPHSAASDWSRSSVISLVGWLCFLSAIGLYGLLATSVAQRTDEIGIRIALGARRGAIIGMILREALRLLGTGMVLGLAVLFVVARFFQSMLYGVSRFDSMMTILTLVLFCGVTILAALLPARRAASVDPIQALRTE